MAHTQTNQAQYELLCPPSLLYRHSPSYTLLHESTRKDPSQRDLARWRTSFVRSHRIKARFFDSTVLLTPNKAQVWEVEGVQSQHQSPSHVSQTSRQNSFETILDAPSNQLLEEIRCKMFPKNIALPIAMNKLDRTYRASNARRRVRKEVMASHRLLDLERRNASPEYLAPICSDALSWGLDCKQQMAPATIALETNLTRREYGNCLVSFRCPCCQVTRCLIHPTGPLLSVACISILELPQESTLSPSTDKDTRSEFRHEVEIGEQILQISQCSPWKADFAYFVIRSANYVTVVCAQSKGTCMFSMKLVRRIDLRSLSRRSPSFRPRFVAAHPKYGHAFTDPLIAVISNVHGSPTSNVVHCGLESPVKHHILNLQNIDLIEFSALHPMILFAAARSYIRPALVKNFVSKRPILGLGSSLYTIDLRSNQAAFQWSPSSSEFCPEYVHSISGIQADLNKEHCCFINSISAAKLWELDTRMSCRVLNSWSLPGLAQAMGFNTHAGDQHGGWTLLHQPRDVYGDGVLRPLLSVDTSIEAFDFCVYQGPLTRPLFETPSLEISYGPSLKGVSIARGCVFPLPDVSSSVFTCGIASFRDNATSFLTSNQHSARLGCYKDPPSKALSVITLTNMGDIYSSVLLECSDGEVTRVPIQGGSTKGIFSDVGGTKHEKAPGKPYVERIQGGFKLHMSLSDNPAIPSRNLTKTIVETRSECEPFTSIPLHEVRQQWVRPSLMEGDCFSISGKLDAAIQDLRTSTNNGFNQVQGSVCHDLVNLGGSLWIP